MPAERLVHYSLSLSPTRDCGHLLDQLDASLEGLRRHNRSIPVAVLVHGPGDGRLTELGRRHRAELVTRPDYGTLLAEIVPEAAPSLVHYPLLHKFWNFEVLAEIDPRSALYVDCDTLFFGDVERLFDGYGRAGHVVAREEPGSRRSHYGYDPTYLDEEALASLTAALGIRPIPPFNTGAVLLNELPWRSIASIGERSVEIAWRFLIDLVHRLDPTAANRYGPSAAAADLRSRLDDLRPDLALDALPFPSPNHWILDEVSLWLALGQVPGLQVADFDRSDVVQNGELFAHRPDDVPAVLCHYYSQNTERVRAWSNGRPAPVT